MRSWKVVMGVCVQADGRSPGLRHPRKPGLLYTSTLFIDQIPGKATCGSQASVGNGKPPHIEEKRGTSHTQPTHRLRGLDKTPFP